MEIIRKILLAQSIFPIGYFDDEVVFTFGDSEMGEKKVKLSLVNSYPLENLVNKHITIYEILAQQGIEKIENLRNVENKFYYRYTFLNDATYSELKYLIIFGFSEYRDCYNCQIFGVLKIKFQWYLTR